MKTFNWKKTELNKHYNWCKALILIYPMLLETKNPMTPLFMNDWSASKWGQSPNQQHFESILHHTITTTIVKSAFAASIIQLILFLTMLFLLKLLKFSILDEFLREVAPKLQHCTREEKLKSEKMWETESGKGRDAYIYIYMCVCVEELKIGPIVAFLYVKNWSIFCSVLKTPFSLQKEEDSSQKNNN